MAEKGLGKEKVNKGQSARGPASEGASGAKDKPAHVYQHKLNQVEETVVRGWGISDPNDHERATLRANKPESMTRGEPAEQGLKANFGLGSARQEMQYRGSGSGSQYKGEFYETPESVPDEGADQNEIPPESVIHRSRNI